MSWEADEHHDEYKREQYERDHPAPDPILCDRCERPMTMTSSHPGIAQSWAGPGEPASEEWECLRPDCELRQKCNELAGILEHMNRVMYEIEELG